MLQVRSDQFANVQARLCVCYQGPTRRSGACRTPVFIVGVVGAHHVEVHLQEISNSKPAEDASPRRVGAGRRRHFSLVSKGSDQGASFS